MAPYEKLSVEQKKHLLAYLLQDLDENKPEIGMEIVEDIVLLYRDLYVQPCAEGIDLPPILFNRWISAEGTIAAFMPANEVIEINTGRIIREDGKSFQENCFDCCSSIGHELRHFFQNLVAYMKYSDKQNEKIRYAFLKMVEQFQREYKGHIEKWEREGLSVREEIEVANAEERLRMNFPEGEVHPKIAYFMFKKMYEEAKTDNAEKYIKIIGDDISPIAEKYIEESTSLGKGLRQDDIPALLFVFPELALSLEEGHDDVNAEQLLDGAFYRGLAYEIDARKFENEVFDVFISDMRKYIANTQLLEKLEEYSKQRKEEEKINDSLIAIRKSLDEYYNDLPKVFVEKFGSVVERTFHILMLDGIEAGYTRDVVDMALLSYSAEAIEMYIRSCGNAGEKVSIDSLKVALLAKGYKTAARICDKVKESEDIKSYAGDYGYFNVLMNDEITIDSFEDGLLSLTDNQVCALLEKYIREGKTEFVNEVVEATLNRGQWISDGEGTEVLLSNFAQLLQQETSAHDRLKSETPSVFDLLFKNDCQSNIFAALQQRIDTLIEMRAKGMMVFDDVADYLDMIRCMMVAVGAIPLPKAIKRTEGESERQEVVRRLNDLYIKAYGVAKGFLELEMDVELEDGDLDFGKMFIGNDFRRQQGGVEHWIRIRKLYGEADYMRRREKIEFYEEMEEEAKK